MCRDCQHRGDLAWLWDVPCMCKCSAYACIVLCIAMGLCSLQVYSSDREQLAVMKEAVADYLDEG